MHGQKFYGVTTIGEKGQIVIPAEARKTLKTKKGEKLLVFGMGDDMIAICKIAKIADFAKKLAAKLRFIRKMSGKAGVGV